MTRQSMIGEESVVKLMDDSIDRIPANKTPSGHLVFFHWGSKMVLRQLTASGRMADEHYQYFRAGLERGMCVSTNMVDSAQYIKKHEDKEGGGELVVVLVDPSIRMVQAGHALRHPNWSCIPLSELQKHPEKIGFTHLNADLIAMFYHEEKLRAQVEALCDHPESIVSSRCSVIIGEHYERPHSPHAEGMLKQRESKRRPAAYWAAVSTIWYSGEGAGCVSGEADKRRKMTRRYSC